MVVVVVAVVVALDEAVGIVSRDLNVGDVVVIVSAAVVAAVVVVVVVVANIVVIDV